MRTRRSQRGFTTLAILVLATLALIAVMVLANASAFEVRLSRKAQDRVTGLTLAEAGMDEAVFRLQSNIDAAGSAGTLYEVPGDTTRPFGTYRTTITALDTDTTRKVVSTGTNTNGTEMTVAAIVVQQWKSLGSAALMANGPIDVGGTATIQTNPNNLHIADVWANGNVSMGGSSFVDGTLQATGTVTGQAYYPSVSGAPAYQYPSLAKTAQWKADWIARAQAGSTTSAVRGSATITAPTFINGDLSLQNSEQVTISGPGVVYVNGSISLQGSSKLVNGATLVVRDTFSQTGSATYQIATVTNPTEANPTPTLVVYGTGSGASANVIQIGGGSGGAQHGIIYAVNGSIAVAGGSTITGALIAAGQGASITVQGNYVHNFPKDMRSEVKFPDGVQLQRMVEM